MEKDSRIQTNMGFCDRQIFDRSNLVVLFVLAAGFSGKPVWLKGYGSIGASRISVYDVYIWKYWWWMDTFKSDEKWMASLQSKKNLYVDLCFFCNPHCICSNFGRR